MRAGAVAVAVLGALVLAGCSGDEPEPTSSADAKFAQQVKSALSVAEAGTANELQLSILRDAQTAGVLTFEAYKTAVDATLECFREKGVKYELRGIEESRGFPTIEYMVEGDETGVSAAAAVCLDENLSQVDTLYQTQPASVDAEDRRFVNALPILIPCLREEGLLPPDSTPTRDEVEDAIWAGFDSAEDGSAPQGFDPTACLTEAGITSGGF